MNRQFIPIKPGQKIKLPVQAQPATNMITELPDASPVPILQAPKTTRKGLLSTWKAGLPYTTGTPVPANNLNVPAQSITPYLQNRSNPLSETGIIEQDTVIQRAVQTLDTGPLFNRSIPVARQVGQHPSQRSYADVTSMFDPQGPISPHQSAAGVDLFVRKPEQPQRLQFGIIPMWARVAVVALLLILIIPGGIGVYYYLTLFPTLNNSVGQQVVRMKGDDNPDQKQIASGDVLSGGRMNLLLLGSDTDYKTVHDLGGALAQTIIVITIDPATKNVSMLSLPRDTWLNVPGHGMHKLDQAYQLGGGSAGGIALTMETIHQDFGVYIDHYAWVGLDGFVKVIDTVGGVDIDTTHPITDDLYPDDACNCARDAYAVKPLYIAPGPQHLNGEEALEYVRSRHADLIGDFGRSVRQQQVLTQLKNKLNNPDIIGKMQDLANALNGHVKTDMETTQAFQVVNFARSLDQSKINRVTLAPYSSTTAALPQYQNQSVVLLNCGQILPVISKTFDLGDRTRCNLQGYAASTPFTVASTTHTMQNANNQTVTGDPASTLNHLTNVATVSIQGGQSELFGMRSLLDLLLAGVFESPDAMRV